MRIGVMMHVTDTTATVAELAREAESRGFESVFVTEHTHFRVCSVPLAGHVARAAGRRHR